MKIVAYYRVSTAQRGRSGLGLEAQRETVTRYAQEKKPRVVESFTEIESGSNVKVRPKLAKALHLAKIEMQCILPGAGQTDYRKH